MVLLFSSLRRRRPKCEGVQEGRVYISALIMTVAEDSANRVSGSFSNRQRAGSDLPAGMGENLKFIIQRTV